MSKSIMIVAAGNSIRFGSNKMLEILPISKKTIIETTLSFFNKTEYAEKVCVYGKTLENYLSTLKKTFPNWTFIEGGETRSESVRNGLKLIKNDWVFIHDGCRPFITENIIMDLWSNRENNVCVIPGLNPHEAIGITFNNFLFERPLKTEVVIIQTPQLCEVKTLKKIYSKNLNLNFEDESKLFLFNDKFAKIKVVNGDRKNIKITHKGDLNYE